MVSSANQVLRHSPPPSMDFSLPVEQMRQVVSAMEKTAYDSYPRFDTQETVIDITMRDGYQSELHIVKPGNLSSANPWLFLYLEEHLLWVQTSNQLSGPARSQLCMVLL